MGNDKEFELRGRLKDFFEDYISFIDENDFDEFYKKAKGQLLSGDVGKLTYALYSSDINPLPYVTSIHYSMFCNQNTLCDGSFVIPENIKQILTRSFENCWSMSTLHLPNSLEFIDRNCFSGCDMLDRIYYHGTAEDWINKVSRAVSWDYGLRPGCDIISYIDGEVLYIKE